MPQLVALPDGTQLSFPDGMSQADMASAIYSNFPQFKSQDAPVDADQPLGDPSGAGDFASIANQPTGAPGSVLNSQPAQPTDTAPRVIGPSATEQQVDPELNRQAYQRTLASNPDLANNSVMFQPGRERQAMDEEVQRAADRSSRARAGQPEATVGNIATGLQSDLALSAFKTVQGLRQAYADATGDTATADEAKRFTQMADKWQQEATPRFDSTLGEMAYHGASGLVSAAPMVAAGTLNPWLGIGLFGAQAGASGYGKYRARGATEGEAALGGGLEGAIMAGTSMLPLKFIADKIGKVGMGEFVTGLVARDVPTMVAQGIANDMVDTAVANPNKTWGDFIAEQPQHIAQSVVSAAIFAAGMGVGHGTANAARRGMDIVQAKTNPSAAFGRARGEDVDNAQFAPAQAVAPVTEGYQPNPNLRTAPVERPESGARPPEQRATVDDVLNAPTVDDAIAAAQRAAQASGPSLREQMLAIRPLEEAPNVSRETAVPADFAGADGSGVPEPARGVVPGAGSGDESIGRMAQEPAAARAASEPVSLERPADAVATQVGHEPTQSEPIEVRPAAEVESRAAEVTARRNETGTVTIMGDPAAVAALLRAHDIPYIPSKDGALVGRSRAADAERVVADFAVPKVVTDSTPATPAVPLQNGPTPEVRIAPPVSPPPGKLETVTTRVRSEVPKVERLEPEQAPLFRRSDNEPAVGKSAQIHDAISKLTRDWLRKPDIHVLRSMDEAPEPVRRVWEQQNSQGAVGDIEGFHWKGGVYLVGDALRTKADVQRVLFHESLGHFGLRGVFGNRLDGILNEVAAALPKDIARKAEQYGFDLSDKRQRLQAAEEVLAEMAQTRPEMGIVKRAVAAIRTWLREHGIDSLKMTRDEIIRNYLLPARGYVERGRDSVPSFARQERVAFSRDENNAFPPVDQFDRIHVGPGGGAGGASNSTAFRVVDLFGNGSRVQHFDDRRGLFYESQRYPSGRVGWKAGEIIDGQQHWLSDREFASMQEAAASVRGQKAANTRKANDAAKYGAIPNTWTGEANKVARALIDAGAQVDRFSSSTQSTSKYIYLLDGRKVRLADHALPPSYEQADHDFRYGGDIAAFVREVEPNEPSASAAPDANVPQTETPAFKKWFGASKVVDGTRRPIVNDKGQPLVPAQDTQKLKNFWRWFGDSKVVDERGRPVVMYHGTSKSQDGEAFTMFDTYASNYGLMGQGGYFTADPRVASEYTRKGRGDTPSVYATYLKIERPLDMDAKADAEAWKKQFQDAEDFHEGGETNESWYRAAEESLRDQELPMYEGAEIMQDGLRAMGYDGITHVGGGRVDKDGVRHRVYIAFDPEQIKSAIGNRGTFDGTNPDISFSRATDSDPDLPDEVRKPYSGFGARMVAAAGDMLSTLRNDLMMKVAPMSATDNKQAQAMAQTYANQTRWAQVQWGRLQRFLEKNFTPDERKAMWEAADAENVERIREREQSYTRPEGSGLASLTPKQREAVETLHEYGQGLWNAAREAGMVEGEGLPFWTPRMLVTIGEDGDIGKLRSLGGGPKMATDGTGRNITTTASSAKHRKYLTTEETEAAGSALAKEQGAEGAQVVRDILTMPLAMYRLERAIAGRRLINQIKEIGQATGQDLIRNGAADGYLTIPHPAFTTYRPRFTKNEEGKTVAMTDESGNVVMDRVPLYIRKDFEGPLRAVMSTKDSSLYTGYMLLKSKAMSAIMFSPLIHNMVIWGKAIPASPLKMLTFQFYVQGHKLAADPALMKEAVLNGMVPIGENRSQSIDVTDIAQNFKPLGDRWGDPNESWLTLSIEKLGNLLHEGAGTSAKAKLDAAGEFLHHTLLWKQIGALQMGIYADAKARYEKAGFSPEAAGIQAAHLANRYGGVVAKENQSELARKWANVLLFSRSFNFTNLGTIKDTWGAMPTGLKALLAEKAPNDANRAEWQQRRKAWSVVALDVGLAVIATSLVQDLVDAIKKDKTVDEILQGYVDRAKDMAANIGAHPLTPNSYNPYRLSSTYRNEPGKKDRVDMGAAVGDRHEYMRLPTGKVAEDLIGWVTDLFGTFERKAAPIPKAIAEATIGKTTIGMPVQDPNGSIIKRIGEGVAHVLKAQLPWDDITRVYDWMQGHATDLDKKKVVGTLTGFTFSQGHPGGPEAAVAQQTTDRFESSRRYTMQLVKEDLKRGDEDKARERMEAIGMTPREINRAIIQALEPRSGLSKQARQKFERRANEEERHEMERQRR